jgi:adenine-specific DNA-methyltransferase
VIEKLKMQTPNITEQNREQIAKLFPHVMTETQDGKGNTKKAIDFELLKQSLSDVLVEGSDERYRLDWPGKKAALLKANTPITKTLRPCREESVNFDSTENVYIEGDNFEVLKILQESYLGKIKMIYIDPPYNTGKDFIYKDNFTAKKADYEQELGATDEEDNKLFKNTDTNGRFHSDWLSMMYERLVVARDLLKEYGVIFISIDDNEVHNLREICGEIFGEENFIGSITWLKKRKGSFLSQKIISVTEWLLVYGKCSDIKLYGGKADDTESQPLIKRTNSVGTLSFPKNSVKTKLQDGKYQAGIYGNGTSSVELLNDIDVHSGEIVTPFQLKGSFIWGQNYLTNQIKNGAKLIINTINFQVRAFKAPDESAFKGVPSLINGVEFNATNEDGYEQLRDLLGAEKIMDYPKPFKYIELMIKAQTHWEKDSIILDFFSGSATTAHAVMQLNAEDNGNRKFIMVQLPEATDEESEAYKAGYKTITEIGKERIRRAGNKILEDNQDKEGIDKLDIGFRVYKTDTSNMKAVYYHPEQLKQDDLFALASNIKEDRTPGDLLTQVILDLGLELNLPIEQKEMHGNKVFIVQTNALVACFDDDINVNIIDDIAALKPFKVVFKDASFAESKDRINMEERFKRLSPETLITVI